ncbi:BUR6 (YER159C) [Zygosaccharomyces parabailii]|uniref:BN860_12024g1_1 n=1 Tax=Zygosaccharomyces bailii (strain CLIB 213 / ATCC 58445 / CBS 680 / BCRC 21525 / NBRC 1098 / NCYC 1416 / NRRL Y-2227) TaxID=1333698 RepID=A0A8J2T3N7_ZYGB2|nr:BUR6 (YER159C) [Zygosaccharomyces parabailii]CDF88514.1 BN860_12024g1_1 [Zygosaccharomyces bailii CLIB 213]CDH14607.1 related to Negative cofactor 2 complex subunit alpha [Zygosaccharomyces bailii ISA1307]
MDQNILEEQPQVITTKVPDEKAVMELQDVFDKIKTHFPPAKVKKIMQTDEDIGKVSQATPVIAGRSLEFFIALLVKRSSDTARRLGCKRISGEVMKETILTDEKFDFLRENVCGERFDGGDEQEQDSSTNE